MGLQVNQIRGTYRKAILAVLCAFGTGLYAQPAHAQTDALIEGAKLCTRQLPRYEREYGIPTHLLSAIASTESGRYHGGLKIKVPWPWTVNADGNGYYLDSKAEAIALVRKLQRKGIKSIDVGCMQVNLVHHPYAFSSIDEAFDPEHNVAYAASYLRSIYEDERSWKKAAAYYHSRVPARGTQYVGNVYRSWYNIVDKLRMAEVSVPASSIKTMNSMKHTSRSELAGSKSSGARVYAAKYNGSQDVKVTRLPEQAGRKVAAYHSPRMNSIKVTTAQDSPRQDNGVIVVTPDIKVVDQDGVRTASNVPAGDASASGPKSIQVAQVAAPTSTIVYTSSDPLPAAPVSHAVVLRASTGAARPDDDGSGPRKSGPTFIFND